MTKDAEKLLYCLYKIYLERRKSGMPKSEAMIFEDGFYKSDKHLSTWLDEDISTTMQELKKCHQIKTTIDGTVILENDAISAMENRFKNGLTQILDVLSKLF